MSSNPVCCETVYAAGSFDATAILTALEIDLQVAEDVTVAAACGNSSSCEDIPLCCEDMYSNDTVGVNCSTVIIIT